jgi:hypothetical protein
MAGVVVLILHPGARPGAGPLECWVAEARGRIAERHRAGFLAAGATDVRLLTGPPDDTTFGARVRAFAERERPGGVVVLGAGSVPLVRPAQRRALLAAAAGPGPRALTNNRYSADVVAVAGADVLLGLPDLASDNALPRWLAEVAGYAVAELGGWRIGIDVDGPLDLVLLRRAGGDAGGPPAGVDVSRAEGALQRVAAATADRTRELVVTGRMSAASLRWLERNAAARVRALVEERGLRASDPSAASEAPLRRRPPASIVGAALERDGPGALGDVLARLGDAALVDSRVLLAHRLGADEVAWPAAEDRYASDLLLHERIADAWLRELTRSAAEAAIPIVLGGHTLVGPGLRLAVRRRA